MKTIKTQKTELRTIQFKSHTLGKLFTVEFLVSNETSENENGYIYGGRILSIKNSNMFDVSIEDYRYIEFDFYQKIDSLNRKLLKS